MTVFEGMNEPARARRLPRSLLVLAVVACSGHEKSSEGTPGTGGTAGGGAVGASSSGSASGGAGAVAKGGTGGAAGAGTSSGSGAVASGAPNSSSGAGGSAGSSAAGANDTASGAGAGGQAGTRDHIDMPDAGASGEASVECGRCTAYAVSMQTGTVEPAELNALSGLAVSRAQSDILFAHNDHDRPVVYALDLQGRQHARIALDGAAATDIEDIAVGPCGTETCVYLADVGDNTAQRDEYAILRFVTPVVPVGPGNTTLTVAFERFRFTYEDGSHNAESLMVAPDGTIYIVTKLAPGSGGSVSATGPSSIYRLPASLSPSSAARATKVATLTVPRSGEAAASAAAAHPCGQGFVLRTYDRVYEFVPPAGMGFEAAFSAQPKVVTMMPDEPQSEGIDYRADGRGFVTSGEGTRAPIVQTGCAE